MKLLVVLAVVILAIASPSGYGFSPVHPLLVQSDRYRTTTAVWNRVPELDKTLSIQEHNQNDDFVRNKKTKAFRNLNMDVATEEEMHYQKLVASHGTHTQCKQKPSSSKKAEEKEGKFSFERAKKTAAAALATLFLTASLSWPSTAAVSGGRLGGSFIEESRPSPTPQMHSRSYYSPGYEQGFRRGFRSGYYTSPPRITLSPYGYGMPSPFLSPFGASPFGSPFFSPYFDRYYMNPFGYPYYRAYPRPFLGFEFRF